MASIHAVFCIKAVLPSQQGLQSTAGARGGTSRPLQGTHASLCTLLHSLLMWCWCSHATCTRSDGSTAGELPSAAGLHYSAQAGKPAEVLWRAKYCNMKVWSATLPSLPQKMALGQAVFTWMWRATGIQVSGVQRACPKKPMVLVTLLKISVVSCRGLNQGWSSSPTSFLQVVKLMISPNLPQCK